MFGILHIVMLFVAKGRLYAELRLMIATLRKPLKREKSRNMGESGRWGKDFRMILGGFAIFAVDIVGAISYNTICIVV